MGAPRVARPKSGCSGENYSKIIKLFARNIDNPIPESKLLLAVLGQAVTDVLVGEGVTKREAIHFFVSGKHHLFCDLIGLDGEWVLEIMRDYGGLYEQAAA